MTRLPYLLFLLALASPFRCARGEDEKPKIETFDSAGVKIAYFTQGSVRNWPVG